jgi:hypothetical protein
MILDRADAQSRSTLRILGSMLAASTASRLLTRVIYQMLRRDLQSGPLNDPMNRSSDQGPHPQAEIGNSDDSFMVYRGKIDNPLDAPPVWRYEAKNGLKPHTVPAVDVFRKTVDEAEQAAAKQP